MRSLFSKQARHPPRRLPLLRQRDPPRRHTKENVDPSTQRTIPTGDHASPTAPSSAASRSSRGTGASTAPPSSNPLKRSSTSPRENAVGPPPEAAASDSGVRYGLGFSGCLNLAGR
ncbi:hypothetical protein ZWY2020_008884 [Hordeum vulgare]|nr:hypothetical protein ZWY2020_008884 [Hordeum vulgare]